MQIVMLNQTSFYFTVNSTLVFFFFPAFVWFACVVPGSGWLCVHGTGFQSAG